MQNKHYTWSKNFPNGDRYKGEAIGENVKDGYGEFFWAASGATYVGQWENDKPHGTGKYTIPGDEGYVYEGEFVKGERSGKGTCTFTNGRHYKGEWLADLMHGTGCLSGAAGVDEFTEYTGSFVRGERSGADGVCHYANGDTYKGSWLHDKRHGHGELQVKTSDSDGSFTSRPGGPPVVSYTGAFVKGEPYGTGEFRYSDNSTYRGECNGFWRHGEGEHHMANGDMYRGHFIRDYRHGKGILRDKLGVFDAEWHEGHLEGFVSFRASTAAADGLTFYEGPSVGGEMTGAGAVAKFNNGTSYHGEMLCGRPSGRGVLENYRVTVAGMGEVIFRYDGEFLAGIPRGRGEATVTVANPAPPIAPSPTNDTCGFVPSYSDAGQYSGEWSKGLPNGNGEWRWGSDRQYRGVVQNGLPNGAGVFREPRVVYEGSFSLGVPDGRGKARWFPPNAGDAAEPSDTYEGEWKDGLCDGDGVLVVAGPQGHTYTGAWRRGLPDGRGFEVAPGRYRYAGNFREGQRHGHGTLHDETNGSVYDGEFALGNATGRGKMTLVDGTVYEGEFLDGKPHGAVELRLPTRGVFIGRYEKGVVCGTGSMRYPNGDSYEGEFMDDGDSPPLRHGRGVYTFAEGNVLQCTWQRNVLDGEGMYTPAGGTSVPRTYVNGVLFGGASIKAGDVFQPGNEFPNTLSEDALRERQQTRNAPCRVLVRRKTLPQPPTHPPTQAEAGGNPPAHSPPPQRSMSQQPPVATAPSTDTVPSGKVVHPSLRILKRNTLPDRRDEAKDVKASPRAGTQSPGLVERFQKNIRELMSASHDGDEEEAVSSLRALPNRKDELMLKAASIRDSREDEIHLLTEELRQLNERIWQVSFLLSSPEPGSGEKEEGLLRRFINERQQTVEKLSCLLNNQ